MKVTDTLCPCCRNSYIANEGHDYETCVKICEIRVEKTRYIYHDALECLEMAKERRQAQREGKIK